MNLARMMFPNLGSGSISRFATTLLLGILLTSVFIQGNPGFSAGMAAYLALLSLI
jgi:hypothetical protein